MFNKKLFGETLRTYRLAKRHSLYEVKTRTDVAITTLWRYETGNVNPDISNIMAICYTYLKIPIDVFNTTNEASASNLLDSKTLHTFASLIQYLSSDEIATINRISKRYTDMTIFINDVVKQTFHNQKTTEEYPYG